METKKDNFDFDLNALKEIEFIVPGDNFETEIFRRIKSSGKSKSKLRSGSLIVIFLIINILSFYKLLYNHNESRDETVISSVIDTFSLDK